MLKQLSDMKSNKISVLQTAGKALLALHVYGRHCLHAGTAVVCEPALSLLHTTAAIYLSDHRTNQTASNIAFCGVMQKLNVRCYSKHG